MGKETGEGGNGMGGSNVRKGEECKERRRGEGKKNGRENSTWVI